MSVVKKIITININLTSLKLNNFGDLFNVWYFILIIHIATEIKMVNDTMIELKFLIEVNKEGFGDTLNSVENPSRDKNRRSSNMLVNCIILNLADINIAGTMISIFRIYC